MSRAMQTTSEAERTYRPSGIRWQFALDRALTYLLVAIFLFVVLLPFYWIFISSITPKYQMFSIPPRYFPRQVTFDNYLNMARAIPYAGYLGNSLIFALGSSLVSVILSFLASYALARIHFRGSNVVFMFFVP